MNIGVSFQETQQTFGAGFESFAAPGKGGLSAYEVAVQNGFDGTEQEWLASLKGEPGERGPQGVQGPQGPKGSDGPQGPSGQNGKDGYTPVLGKDYFTAADKAEMVSAVLAALPVYSGEVADV